MQRVDHERHAITYMLCVESIANESWAIKEALNNSLSSKDVTKKKVWRLASHVPAAYVFGRDKAH